MFGSEKFEGKYRKKNKEKSIKKEKVNKNKK